MGKLDAAAVRRAEQGDYITENPNANRGRRMTWHDPITGQEFPNMLSNQPAMLMDWLSKGWMMGRASPALRKKWAASEVERQRVADADEEKARKARLMREAKEAPPAGLVKLSKEQLAEIADLVVKAMTLKKGKR